MHHSTYTFSPLHPFTRSLHTGQTATLPPACDAPLLTLEMTINSTALYLGQYYKVNFSLKNNCSVPLTDLEVHWDLQNEWFPLSDNPFILPSYISRLAPEETLQFSVVIQLVELPHRLPHSLNSYVSYHIDGHSLLYIQNSLPIYFTVAPQQAALHLSVERRQENRTVYLLLIQNAGTVPLSTPILYLFMPPSIRLCSDSLLINEATVQLNPNKGIRLADMPPQTLYMIYFTTMFLSGHPSPEQPKIQLISHNVMFHLLPS